MLPMTDDYKRGLVTGLAMQPLAVADTAQSSFGVGMKSPLDPTSEIFNCYDGNNVAGQENQSCYATARGYYTQATGYYSCAEGGSSKAIGNYSHAEGAGTQATGDSSHAEGSGTTASGNDSHAEGGSTKASGNYSHAEGNDSLATAYCAHAEGGSTQATQQYAHSEGCGTKASGYQAHVEGLRSEASGNSSHAEGEGCKSIGYGSHAQGMNCVASGFLSHAGGRDSTAGLSQSFAHGNGLQMAENGQTSTALFGEYNDYSDTNVIFAVGNGSSDSSRSNAFAVDKEGNIYCKSIIQTSATAAASPLAEYEYLTDLSVKFNGVTYTVEKDDTTGLISKITDSVGNEFEPTINSGITDTAFHNAVFMAVAMCKGLSKSPEIILFSGATGSWAFSNGLTGFKSIRGSWQASSDTKFFAQQIVDGYSAIVIEKSHSITNSADGYTDTLIVRSNEKIDLTKYSKLRILAILYQNLPAGMTAKAFFNVGEPSAPQQSVAYDFTDWKEIDSTKYYTNNWLTNPGEFKWYDIDISDISGEQYLNFAVYHGAEHYQYSAFLSIKQIILQ